MAEELEAEEKAGDRAKTPAKTPAKPETTNFWDATVDNTFIQSSITLSSGKLHGHQTDFRRHCRQLFDHSYHQKW